MNLARCYFKSSSTFFTLQHSPPVILLVANRNALLGAFGSWAFSGDRRSHPNRRSESQELLKRSDENGSLTSSRQ
jgi:hypothetical protein